MKSSIPNISNETSTIDLSRHIKKRNVVKKVLLEYTNTRMKTMDGQFEFECYWPSIMMLSNPPIEEPMDPWIDTQDDGRMEIDWSVCGYERFKNI